MRTSALLLCFGVSVLGCGDSTNGGDGSTPIDMSIQRDFTQSTVDLTTPTVDLAGADLTGTQSLPDFAGVDTAGLDLLQSLSDLTQLPDLATGACSGNVSCYSGPNGTSGVGVCRPGTEQCVAGMLGTCTGEVDPAAESCNGFDDDCNGKVDDGLGNLSCGVGACKNTVPACTAGKPTTCTPGSPTKEVCGNGIDDDCNGLVDDGCACVYVAPTGNDSTGTGSATAPFLTIAKAVAAAGGGGLPSIVCVASGATCPTQADYQESVTMRNGISVYGGYRANGSTWPRVANCVTRIIDQDATGVHFDATVTKQTILDGFTVLGHGDATSAAITVEGSTGAVVSNNAITGGGTATSYGVNVIDSNKTAATPTITMSGISGGNGSALSIGVHSLNSAPLVQANCDTIGNGGLCTAAPCFSNVAPVSFIRGRASTGTGTETYGVRLESSPNAVVDQNAICASGASGDEAGVRLSGDGTGVLIHANNIAGTGTSMNSVGFWADPCNGASPWLLANTQVSGNSSLKGGRADGVRAIGNCHARIDSNVLIVGGQETANADVNGVYCERDAGTGISSRCTVLSNLEIRGASAGYPPTSTGVHCDDGACARIEQNAITAHGGIITYGVHLGNTNTFVNANVIDGGCATTTGMGLFSENSSARVQNNAIGGSTCNGTIQGATTTYGIRAIIASGGNEIDIHSNDLYGGGANAAGCVGTALAFDVAQGGTPPTGPVGMVRNNILLGSACPTSYDLAEQSTAADPRLVENNDFWTQNLTPTALYRDEAANNLTMASQVNGLTDITASANLSVDPLVNTALHLQAGSPCIDTGIATGAPTTDIDGDKRPIGSGFDIGWDEYNP